MDPSLRWGDEMMQMSPVMPAKAGIHADRDAESGKPEWTPAFAGVTR
ncbi:MAG: hypothetical protein QOG72_1166 [Sphingomonadales bacterium]|jgi:hypothetical protein|nr:hypothetical protein [Sphingomonadales bacterium]